MAENKGTFKRIYEVVRQIPRGYVATYGMVAKLSGNKRWSQVVGYALHVNPEPGIIPCHRVVKKDGSVSEAFAFGGADGQRELLMEEGINFIDGKVDMARHLWDIPVD